MPITKVLHIEEIYAIGNEGNHGYPSFENLRISLQEQKFYQGIGGAAHQPANYQRAYKKPGELS